MLSRLVKLIHYCSQLMLEYALKSWEPLEFNMWFIKQNCVFLYDSLIQIKYLKNITLYEMLKSTISNILYFPLVWDAVKDT